MLKAIKKFILDCRKDTDPDGRQVVENECGELCHQHRYEEFADYHTGVNYRMDESLPFLAPALSG